MSIESVGAYSPDTVYGQLTMPFVNKPVHINAHTPLDEDVDTVTTKRSYYHNDELPAFYNDNSEARVSIEDIRNIKPLELDDNLKVDIGIKMAEEFPPKPNVGVFQASVLRDGTGVVFNALQNGYPADKAITIGNAFKSYKNAMSLDANPVQTLINTNFAVA